MDAFLEIFSTRGRANRGWWLAHVLVDDFLVATAFIALMLVGQLTGMWFVALPLVGLMGAAGWAAIAVTVKRFHDLGKSGWNVLLMAVPLVNVFVGLWLLLGKGDVGPNQYGPDPLARDVEPRENELHR